jgi:flavorubredoxin
MVVGGRKLEFIPAHYLHASANFHVYDAEAKVFFSGDVGAALLPPGHSAWVGGQGLQSSKAFDDHIQHAKFFHQRWMPSNGAKKDWIDRVRQLDIEFLCPQHGAIYAGENVQRFLNWFDGLTVGTALSR